MPGARLPTHLLLFATASYIGSMHGTQLLVILLDGSSQTYPVRSKYAWRIFGAQIHAVLSIFVFYSEYIAPVSNWCPSD